MAGFGAKNPCFAPFAADETTAAIPTYSGGVVIGELVAANLTVTLAAGEVWGDNKKIESISEFASGAIPLETVDMVDEVAEVVYGLTVTDGEAHYKPGDEPPYGGLCYIKDIQIGGKKLSKAYFYPKVQAAVGNDNAQTKSASITFQTTTTNFSIMAPLYDEGAWLITKTFETFEEANTWIKTKLSMT